MTKHAFSLWNKLLGWFAFLVAFITYYLTAEPTASFWDAGEYISTSAKLQVGHPPGAPFYQIFGAFFSMFASDESQIAFMVNLMSGVASAFAILFMFWSITLLLKKLTKTIEVRSQASDMAILASSLVGALTFTFTDSFWFSAVEAEVYAMAACLMAAMFYVGLLWERDMHKPRGNRWLILICLIIGLSFGVHFMGLLTIPAIGFLYYFKNYKTITVKNFVIANLVVIGILLFIFKLLLPYSLTFFAKMEVFFVNSIGLPFNSGTIIAGLIVIAGFYFGLKYTRRKNYIHINTVLLCILFVFIGFSSWIMLPIRANAGTVINENDPSSAQQLLAYYNRDQYPETHLFYGPQFTEIFAGLDPDNPYLDDDAIYEKDEAKGEYVIINDFKNAKQNSDAKHKTFLPRMWSTQHASNYMMFTGPLEFSIKPEYRGEQELNSIVNTFREDFRKGEVSSDGYISFLKQFNQYLDIQKPSTASNFNYLLEFQMGYMYWRYFMWNFAGRQNDNQGKYTNFDGNWLSGIDFIDENRLGSQENLPSDLAENKARNTYYFLPLILGLIGLFFHASKDVKRFWVLTVFFLFTGIALKIYLNERPFEPRERDYALVGSFYVFAIWIGLGVYAIFHYLKRYITPKLVAPLVGLVCLLCVPVLMASENWDDHDRSGKYTTLSMAKKYLDSVDEDAILFTIGDNDTFALWYAQEIEGYRTDVRTINTSLFATDWYIDQMRKKAYESEPIETTLKHDDYKYGTNDAVWYQADPRISDTLVIDKFIQYIKSDNETTKAELQSGQVINTFPTKNIRVPVDKQKILQNGIVKPENADLIVPYIDINLEDNLIYKPNLMMLDLLANNDWERPIYFTGGSFRDEDYLWMKDYLQLEGVTYKLVPIKTPVNPNNPFDMGRIDEDKMYDIVMDWEWGNSGSGDIYHDPETRKNAITYRSNLARLVEKLIKENKYDKAEDILDLGMKHIPVKYYQYYQLVEPFITGYYQINKPEKAREVWKQVATNYQEWLDYYAGMTYENQIANADEIFTEIEKYRSLVDILIIQQDTEMVKEKAAEFNSYLEKFSHFYQDSESEDVDQDLLDELNQKDMEQVKKESDSTSLLSPDQIPNE
ncbi:DUF2723 domain-containing protein [Psychroflexus sp. CAK57W]|uniref:glycosyltransferase family 117 protein n=1 Tax=Psychroflexus curvus TaxID=2873595 RepID=UPI001CCDAB9D|nr:DUF2723 domain-containing protein [Psychroflexus curvus]MBZ9627344.1 DUF2723 domain-containing protein [Psychroflexus curvus]MBZ9785853.1 DUF2723 domain-containing protein [Psychroflexus curvus]